MLATVCTNYNKKARNFCFGLFYVHFLLLLINEAFIQRNVDN